MPPTVRPWYASDNETEVYARTGDKCYDVYRMQDDGRPRRNPIYKLFGVGEDRAPPTKHASVGIIDGRHAVLRSVASVSAPPLPPRGLVEELRSWKNQSLWKYFKCDGDGEWIRKGLLRGTIEFIHDGSYMKKVDPRVCSAAYLVRCTRTNLQASGAVVEHSEFADNYRAEALGAMMCLLILRAATTKQSAYRP